MGCVQATGKARAGQGQGHPGCDHQRGCHFTDPLPSADSENTYNIQHSSRHRKLKQLPSKGCQVETVSGDRCVLGRAQSRAGQATLSAGENTGVCVGKRWYLGQKRSGALGDRKQAEWWEGKRLGRRRPGETAGSPGRGQSPQQEARKQGLFLREMDAAEGLCTGTPRQDFRFLRTGRAGTGGSLPLVQVQTKVQEGTWRDGGESEVSGAAGGDQEH